MGVLDVLGKVAKKTTEVAIKGAILTKKSVGQLADNVSYGNREKELKKAILDKLTLGELKYNKKKYGVSQIEITLFDEDSKPTKDDYADLLANKLSFETVLQIYRERRPNDKWTVARALEEKRKIDSEYKERKEKRWEDKSQEEKKEEVKQANPTVNELIEFLKACVIPERVNDEEHLEDVVYGDLVSSKRFKLIDRQRSEREGRNILDLVVDDVAVELKLLSGNNYTRTMLDADFFQAGIRYKKKLKKSVILFIYTTDDYAQQKAEEWDKDYSSETDIQTVIRRGARKFTVNYRQPTYYRRY
jgi:hypothetical protein